MNLSITPEVIAALNALRGFARKEAGWAAREAVNTLDNAGIFAAIDEVAGYDVDPEPKRASKCTCPASTLRRGYGHLEACPGDPAEWGDTAYTSATDEQNKPRDQKRNR